MDLGGIGVNPKDPLPKSGPEGQLDLFKKLKAEASKGYTADQVVGACLNLLVNALRQSYNNRSGVESRYNECMGKTKEFLLSHYDGVTGKRKSIFPFTQYIRPPLIESDDKIKSPGG